MQTETQQSNSPDLHTRTPGFSTRKIGFSYGAFAAILVAVYLIAVNTAFTDLPTGLRFAKHLLLIPPFVLGLRALRSKLPKGKIFKDGLVMGMIMSVVAGIGLAVINILVASINPNMAFEQFLNENNSIGDTIANSVFLAFETFVFGMIISFAILQFLKDGKPADG